MLLVNDSNRIASVQHLQNTDLQLLKCSILKSNIL